MDIGGALQYAGTKSPHTQGLGQWIVGLLPPSLERGQTYIEPFAGMLGVLLSRTKAQVEIANDLDGRVINWWRWVRDEPDEMSRRIALTPNSRAEYERALQIIVENTDSLDAAIAFTVVCQQTLRRSAATAASAWRRAIHPTHKTKWRNGLENRITALADRIYDVQLESIDACDLLDRTAYEQDAVIYVDPPYPSVTPLYSEAPDFRRLRACLLAQRGMVAISGQGEEWDDLGWRREERRIVSPLGTASNHRLGVLWMNYDAGVGQGVLL